MLLDRSSPTARTGWGKYGAEPSRGKVRGNVEENRRCKMRMIDKLNGYKLKEGEKGRLTRYMYNV